MVLTLSIALSGACGHSPSRLAGDSNVSDAPQIDRSKCMTVQPGQYFPPGTFQSSPGEDKFTQRWYSGQLCAMNEEPLTKLPADETYRFLWLRSFHNPVSIRIQAARGRSSLVAVELDGDGGDPRGTIKRREQRELSEQEWRSLTTVLEAAKFWDAPTVDPTAKLVADGAQWIFEGHRSGVYHVVTRLSPESGPLRAVGEAFLQAARLSFSADEVY